MNTKMEAKKFTVIIETPKEIVFHLKALIVIRAVAIESEFFNALLINRKVINSENRQEDVRGVIFKKVTVARHSVTNGSCFLSDCSSHAVPFSCPFDCYRRYSTFGMDTRIRWTLRIFTR
jgi:hypothetical protein